MDSANYVSIKSCKVSRVEILLKYKGYLMKGTKDLLIFEEINNIVYKIEMVVVSSWNGIQ